MFLHVLQAPVKERSRERCTESCCHRAPAVQVDCADVADQVEAVLLQQTAGDSRDERVACLGAFLRGHCECQRHERDMPGLPPVVRSQTSHGDQLPLLQAEVVRGIGAQPKRCAA
eukprot:14007050-Alexandrium_andersonii.AAC.1